MGGQTVNPGSYISKPDMMPMAMMLQQKQQQGLMALENQAKMLEMATKIKPQMQEFDAARVSEEAGELGMANLARSRKYEELVSPEAARMRRGLAGRVEKATSPEALKQFMDEWARTKGITQLSASGIDQDSTIGRSALFDASTEAARQAELQNLALQQGFLTSNAAPMGGLDAGTLIGAQQAVQAANTQGMNAWQQAVLGGAQSLGMSVSDYINSSMGELLSAQQAHQQNRQNYEQAIYQGAAQNAASNNAMTGAYIGAGGAALGAAAIII